MKTVSFLHRLRARDTLAKERVVGLKEGSKEGNCFLSRPRAKDSVITIERGSTIEVVAVTPAPTFGLVPIVVGVTGHRDVPAEDVGCLANIIANVLKQLGQDTPHSPHVFISALAEGADRIAARAALDSGWALGVVMPAPSEVYEQDFTVTESRAEFHELLARAAWVESLPAEITGPHAYRAAGMRMLRQSFYLLALWDGAPDGAEGGTSDLVNLFRHGIPEPTLPGPSDNSLPEARPVLHVLTRRTRALERVPVSNVGQLTMLAPEPAGTSGENELDRWAVVLQRIDQFNADAMLCRNENSVELEQAIASFEKTAPPDLPVAGRAAAAVQATAEVLSAQAQAQRDCKLLWLFGLALLAVFCEQIYSGPIWAAGWLATAIVSGVLAAVLFQHGTRTRLEARYLDYRALAEACRVQYFWKQAGVSACAADHFLRDQRDELEWLRQAVRTTELMPGHLALDANRIDKVGRDWIDNQRNWFIGSGEENGGKASWNRVQNQVWSQRSRWYFKGGIAVTVLLVLLHAFVVPHLSKEGEDALQWLIVTYGMLFGMAGIAAVYLEVKAFPEQARAYRRMGLAMSMARRHLDIALETGDLAAAENVLLGAGRNALAENGGWLLLHRDRPAQVPLG